MFGLCNVSNLFTVTNAVDGVNDTSGSDLTIVGHPPNSIPKLLRLKLLKLLASFEGFRIVKLTEKG